MMEFKYIQNAACSIVWCGVLGSVLKYSVKELQIDKKYILVVVICKPTVAPSDILKTLMAMSTIALIRKYSSLRIFYAKNGSLWDKKCMLSTVGRVNKGIMEGFLDNWLKQKT